MAQGSVTEPVAKGGAGRFLFKFAGAIAILIVAAFGILWGVEHYIARRLAPDPETIATASLEGLREQNKLSAFVGRFVAVVTSKQSRLGLTAQKTLIMPGLVRYEVDLGKLKDRDLSWDAANKTLSLTLPPVEVDPPQVDFAQIQEYGDGGILLSLTDAGKTLDEANRKAGQTELVHQAHGAMPMKLARDATRRAVESSFAMPLRAAGVDATVKVRFADEPVANDEQWDRSRSVGEVLGNAR